MSFCINPNCQKPQNSDNMLFCQSCGSELLLVGRYRVVNLLGGGGFGKTYEVIERNGKTKVLKVLFNTHPKAITLFQQEAQVLSQLEHPGIPKGYEYFIFTPNNGQQQLHCLVMEKIEGLNLEQYMQQCQNRPIDQKLTVEWLTELIAILDEVHKQNFFHRDIKPSNIMLKANGQLVLIDFGTAREVTHTYLAKQVVGQVTGINSPGFTPPEQINGQAVLPSDFFALARTFVYLLTGKRPTDPDIYDPNTDEVRWRNYAPDISPILADLIDEMMRRSPSQRPQSTQVISQRLAEIEKTQTKPGATGQGSKANVGAQTHRRFGFRFPNTSVSVTRNAIAIAAIGLILLAIPYFLGSDSFPFVTSNPVEKWAKNLSLVNTLIGHVDAVSSVAIAPNGQTIASASYDKTIKLWNPQTGKLIRTIYGHSLPVLSLAISPDGQNLVSGSFDETIKQWNLVNGQQIRSFKTDGYVAWNNAIAITPDGKTLATGSTDKTIRLWNFSNGQLLRTLSGHSLPVLAVAVSPDRQTLASGSTDKTIHFWNLVTGQQLYSLVAHTGWVTCLAISPNNQTLISGSLDKTIKLWDVNTRGLRRTLSGHSYSVLAIAISPNSQILASGSLDGEIRLWNLDTGKLLHTISGHTKQVTSLAISQDGQTLVSGSADNTIKIWRSP